MKKGILLAIAIFSFINLSATEKFGVNYLKNDAVTFIDKGVEFHVFLNGDFDFNTVNNNTYYNNRRLSVLRDNFGRVRQVGRTVINYGQFNNVTAIGNVPIRYQYGQLTNVGNLAVNYDRWGYPHYSGFVKQNRFYNDGFNVNVNFGSAWSYDNAYFYDRHFRNNYRSFREDANFFYYRAVPNAKLGKRSQVIKRRKPARKNIDSNRRYLNNNNKFNTNRYNRNRTSTSGKSYTPKKNTKTYTRKASPTTKRVTKTKVVKTTPAKNRNTKRGTSTKTKKTVITKKVTTRNNRSTPTRSRR